MNLLDYEIRSCETYYSSNYSPNYHVRFSSFGEHWKVDLVRFNLSGIWLSVSKEYAHGPSMLEALKNLKELLQKSQKEVRI